MCRKEQFGKNTMFICSCLYHSMRKKQSTKLCFSKKDGYLSQWERKPHFSGNTLADVSVGTNKTCPKGRGEEEQCCRGGGVVKGGWASVYVLIDPKMLWGLAHFLCLPQYVLQTWTKLTCGRRLIPPITSMAVRSPGSECPSFVI